MPWKTVIDRLVHHLVLDAAQGSAADIQRAVRTINDLSELAPDRETTHFHAGTLDEINSAVAEAHGAARVVSLRPIDRADELAKELLLMPFVQNVKPLNSEVAVEIEDTDDAAWGLLEEVPRRGYRIVEYRQRRAQLEDVFMRATKGEVS